MSPRLISHCRFQGCLDHRFEKVAHLAPELFAQPERPGRPSPRGCLVSCAQVALAFGEQRIVNNEFTLKDLVIT